MYIYLRSLQSLLAEKNVTELEWLTDSSTDLEKLLMIHNYTDMNAFVNEIRSDVMTLLRMKFKAENVIPAIVEMVNGPKSSLCPHRCDKTIFFFTVYTPAAWPVPISSHCSALTGCFEINPVLGVTGIVSLSDRVGGGPGTTLDPGTSDLVQEQLWSDAFPNAEAGS